MKYVILRDDDTNALTPVDYLDKLYRPFLDRSLPVSLAVIPNVGTNITYGQGVLEGFLVARNGITQKFVPLTSNSELVNYLRSNPAYCIVQHGCTHEFINGYCEFELNDASETRRRILDGRTFFEQAGLPIPETFVAPYDRFTRLSLEEAAKHFRVISANWYEWRKLPWTWLPEYAAKKLQKHPHWQVDQTILMTHPGCHLSYHRDYDAMLDVIKNSIQQRRLTVLVTHWWEFFRDNKPDTKFIEVLHRTADYLAQAPDIKVVTFDDVAHGRVPVK